MRNPPDPWVIVGRIGKPVGLTGAVRIWTESDLGTLLETEVPLFAWFEGASHFEPLVVVEAIEDPNGWIIEWKGYDYRESTVPLRNAWILVDRANLPEPEEGTAYESDLLGARVETRDGRVLGKIVEFIDCLAHCVIEVRRENGKDFLIPLSEEVDAKFVRAESEGEPSRLLVTLPEGLEEATEVTPVERAPKRKIGPPRRRPTGSGPTGTGQAK